jgi:hypothetical protein
VFGEPRTAPCKEVAIARIEEHAVDAPMRSPRRIESLREQTDGVDDIPTDAGGRREAPLVELLPDEWRAGSDLWVRAYQLVGVPLSAVSPPRSLDLQDRLVLFLWAELPRLQPESTIDPQRDGEIQTSLSTPTSAHPSAPLALVLTRIGSEWTEEVINRCHGEIQEAAGLLTLREPRLVAFPVEDYVLRIPSGTLGPTAVRIARPLHLRIPSLTKPLIQEFEQVGARLHDHPERNRIALALRWLNEAMRDEGTDAFLKGWIALEILAMPETTNVSRINEALAGIYGLARDGANELFLTGRLFGLRSRIVHEGDIAPIDDRLLGYLHALFKDLFFAELGMRVTVARAYLEDDELQLRAHILERTLPR